MIPLTRLNGEQVAINPDRIERADITPDVVLTMTDGSKFVIAESLDELIDRIRLFRASILALSHRLVFEDDDAEEGGARLRVVGGGARLDERHELAVASERGAPQLRSVESHDEAPAAPDVAVGARHRRDDDVGPGDGPDAPPAGGPSGAGPREGSPGR